jgi:endonuclease/exonuclease/phosphatase (EEP) superfamily protein YafD
MGVLTVVGIVTLTIAVVAFIARYTPGVVVPIVATAALAPYLMLGAPAAIILLAVSGAWIAAAISAAVTIAAVAVQWPWFSRDRAEPIVTVRVVSANLQFGRADPDAVAQMARDHADILAVQELTPQKAQLISDAGIDAVFPYRALRAREGPAGVGIWSRYPLTVEADYDEFWLGLITARVRIPGLSPEATVGTVHMSVPWPEPIRGWRDDLARLVTTLQDIAVSADGPVLLAGDLNATRDNLEFRRLLRGGYRDAAEQAGAGLTRTHPADIAIPPLFGLDHILVRGATATSVRTLGILGSDHRALAAVISLQSTSDGV